MQSHLHCRRVTNFCPNGNDVSWRTRFSLRSPFSSTLPLVSTSSTRDSSINSSFGSVKYVIFVVCTTGCKIDVIKYAIRIVCGSSEVLVTNDSHTVWVQSSSDSPITPSLKHLHVLEASVALTCSHAVPFPIIMMEYSTCIIDTNFTSAT